MEKLLLTAEEVADMIGLSKNKVYQMITSGELPSRRIGSKSIRVPSDELRKWVAQSQPETKNTH